MTWMIAGILVYLLYWCGPVVGSITYGAIFFVWLIVMAILWKIGVFELGFIILIDTFYLSIGVFKLIFRVLVS